MKIVRDKIAISELQSMAKHMHERLVKAVVDVEKEIMAVDAGLHSDELEFLIEQENSEPKNLWGINIFPEKAKDVFIQFDSMLNIKPGLGNRTRGVEDPEVQKKIISIVDKLVTYDSV